MVRTRLRRARPPPAVAQPIPRIFGRSPQGRLAARRPIEDGAGSRRNRADRARVQNRAGHRRQQLSRPSWRMRRHFVAKDLFSHRAGRRRRTGQAYCVGKAVRAVAPTLFASSSREACLIRSGRPAIYGGISDAQDAQLPAALPNVCDQAGGQPGAKQRTA